MFQGQAVRGCQRHTHNGTLPCLTPLLHPPCAPSYSKSTVTTSKKLGDDTYYFLLLYRSLTDRFRLVTADLQLLAQRHGHAALAPQHPLVKPRCKICSDKSKTVSERSIEKLKAIGVVTKLFWHRRVLHLHLSASCTLCEEKTNNAGVTRHASETVCKEVREASLGACRGAVGIPTGQCHPPECTMGRPRRPRGDRIAPTSKIGTLDLRVSESGPGVCFSYVN